MKYEVTKAFILVLSTTHSSSELSEKLRCHNTSPSVKLKLHLAQLLVNLFQESNDKVHQLVFVHLFSVEVGDKEADVPVLWLFSLVFEETWNSKHTNTNTHTHTKFQWREIASKEQTLLIGFLRRMTKCSARWAKKRMNFFARISSTSSICFTFTLTRIELIEASMRTRSFLLREIIKGFIRSSLLALS
jgi:hypothetical protein